MSKQNVCLDSIEVIKMVNQKVIPFVLSFLFFYWGREKKRKDNDIVVQKVKCLNLVFIIFKV